MLTKLASVGAPRALGICIDGAMAHGCLITSTPWGVIECGRETAPIDPQKPADGLRALISKFGGVKTNWQVAVGLPVEKIYFTSRPIHAGGGDASPQVLLRESLRSSSVPIDQMLVDVATSQPDNRTIASIVSCDKSFVQGITAPLEQLGLRLDRAEPAPCALLRVALLHDRKNRRSRVACRIFLSDEEMLAVLTARHQPILWRRAKLPRGDEGAVILAAVRSLSTTGEQSGVETRPEVVVVHGRSDLLRLLDVTWIRRELGAQFEWLDDPPLCPSLIARGLAEGCFGEHAKILDLARSVKAQPTLKELFPWRDAVLHTLVLTVMFCFLLYQFLMVQDRLTTASVRNAQSSVASQLQQDLENERRILTQQVSAVETFVESRVLWTNYHRALAEILPDNMFLTSIHGDGELQKNRKASSKSKRQLVVQGAVSIPQDGLIPHEIDRLLNTMRNHDTLVRDFPVIELAELKQFKRPQQNDTLAMFTVICLPKGVKKAK